MGAWRPENSQSKKFLDLRFQTIKKITIAIFFLLFLTANNIVNYNLTILAVKKEKNAIIVIISAKND